MAYKIGNREQITMLPPTIEEYVGEQDPVRVYDAFVEALDLGELGIEVNENNVGNSAYDPRAMLKLLVYGYSYGWRSSRKLERALHHNVSFMWLTGGLRPDHKTISKFRKDNKEAVEEEIEVIVPSQKQALHRPAEESPFDKEKFRYDEKNNQYICPEGKVLRYSHYSKKKGYYLYRIKGPSNCITCKHYGKCTNNKRGRAVIRLKSEKLKEELEALYLSERGPEVYRKRKEKVELPFGHIKRNLKRGLKGVNAEMSLLSTSFNIARMITLQGVTKLIAVLT